MYHLIRCLVLGHNNCMSLVWTYNPFIPWYEFDVAPNGALRHVEGTTEALSFSEWENANVAGTSATGRIVGGLAGAKAGVALGTAIMAWFGGVGAVPDAIIGGIVGSLTGNKVGEIGVNYYYDRSKYMTKIQRYLYMVDS